MKSIFTILCLFIVTHTALYSQQEQVGLKWKSMLSVVGANQDLNDMVADNEGNVYVAGVWYLDKIKPTTRTMLIGKFNTKGDLVWQDTISGVEGRADIAYDIALDKNGDIYVAGTSEEDYATLHGSITLVKYNTSGTRLWQKKYTGPESGVYGTQKDFVRINVDRQNNIYLCARRAWLKGVTILAKFNSAGTLLWEKDIPGSIIYAAITDENGNTYLAGNDARRDSTSWLKYLTMKVASDGTIIWQDSKTEESGAVGAGNDITLDKDNNVFIVAKNQVVSGSSQISVLKYTSSGDFQWKKTKFGDISTIAGISSDIIKSDSQGNVYIVADTNDIPLKDIMLTKYTSSGEEAWSRIYNGVLDQNDFGLAIAIDVQNNIYITGEAHISNSYSPDIITLKYDTQGKLNWKKNNFDAEAIGQHISVTTEGDVLVGGYKREYDNLNGEWFGGFNVLKYSPSTASITKTVNQPGTYVFNASGNNTAITITLNTVSGTGTLNVSYFGFPAVNLEFDGNKPVNISQYKWVIEALGLTGIDAEIKIALDMLQNNGGIVDANDVKIFKREIEGQGAFKELATKFENGELKASITEFSEFILGSNSSPLLVEEDGGTVPKTAMLLENFPEPFKSSTKIRFALPNSSFVKLVIHDSFGREVTTLVNEQLPEGNFYYQFNAENLPAGVYFYTLTASDFSHTKKMTIVR
jgi:hypothetical protein